ncbi:conserved hypothetical protein [uncultured Pleomorphomonas sp.]|uniref:Uncharacterized protein n=1 Tax=uncultured Pleomorphomonas sp. TaxID=442121 RepID=A0A212LR05_9HYPH|nr:hypothetical protein [uncultured Pleomorphomonas sp.]SCM79956.1 conserved hypothetical protein [uncultured Pleomorphomonas sp.]
MSDLIGLTAAEKQDLLRDLQEALFSGVYRVRFRDRDVTYQSAAEMRETISDLESSLGVGRTTKQGVIFTSFGKGL